MIARSEGPSQLLVDAGPIIGAMDVRDEHHENAAAGFRQLYECRTRLLLPVPILFEVYKRIAYLVNARRAQNALAFMQSGFDLIPCAVDDVSQLEELVAGMPWWAGSLEDALLVMIGLARDIPVWTYNYRDLRVFPNLQFWTPASA